MSELRSDFINGNNDNSHGMAPPAFLPTLGIVDHMRLGVGERFMEDSLEESKARTGLDGSPVNGHYVGTPQSRNSSRGSQKRRRISPGASERGSPLVLKRKSPGKGRKGRKTRSTKEALSERVKVFRSYALHVRCIIVV